MNRLTVQFVLPGVAILLAGCKSTPKLGEMGTYHFGERAQVGPLVYTVIESQWDTSLGTDPVPRIPNSRFLLLNLSVVNKGPSDQSVPSFTLEDDRGNSDLELQDGESVPDWIGFGRKLRPSETLTGNVAFDVPPGHYKLKVMDEDQQNSASIDVPLSFENSSVAPTEAGQAASPLPSGIKR